MATPKIALQGVLLAMVQIFRIKARLSPAFRQHLRSRNCVVQIRVRDGSVARYFRFCGGKVTSGAGVHAAPGMTMLFKDAKTALELLMPPIDYRKMVEAGKSFRLVLEGSDETIAWFTTLGALMGRDGWKFGTARKDGTTRFTQMTNGGPLHVDVKDGRIVRMVNLEYGENDPPAWTMTARGRKFTPRRKACVAPHALAMKQAVYSPDRILTPMKRVDFDPNGERNPQNRGISGYEPITWDEALDIVSTEIVRQKREHGPGSIALAHPSHHHWGNLGYYLSAMMRFGNAIGVTRVVLNPDSWEGWYWGAMHHFGNSMRLGAPSGYGTLQDALEHCELMVYWSSDPESQFGCYGGTDASERRLWGRELGIETVHINPHYSPTAAFTKGKWVQIRPGADTALAMAIMYVWLTEGTYDKFFVENRTTGFDEWAGYLRGDVDGVAKTPAWQEAETGVPARVALALARRWAEKKTYLACGLSAGFGGACRNASGIQWARAMVMLMAMQGWGRPGVNFGNLQMGAPLNLDFYFPGYGDGGISGELAATGSAVNNYARMPHLLSMNPVTQKIPRQRLPEAILEGKAEGYLLDPLSLEAQMAPFSYPAPGYAKVKMLYRYGGSAIGTVNGSHRFIEMYRSKELECVVSQSIWMEGESKFADIILPACSQFERWDIGEWSNTSGFGHHWQSQCNHRVIALQHKCIEPLGQSKSDYQIFWDICKRLGLGAYFSEGCTELDWVKRIFDSSDVPGLISWKKFLRKGYVVVPPEPEALRAPVDMRWFYEGRAKDLPEPHPLPAGYSGTYLHGLQTQSGKFEFIPSSLLRLKPENPERPALLRYTRPHDGAREGRRFSKYPLQLMTPHQRFSFHTAQDGKQGAINDLEDHRMLVDGHYYWIVRMNAEDARVRGIRHRDLVKVFNERATVICAAEVTPRLTAGVLHSYESSATYEPLGTTSDSPDRGGCMNLLTTARMQAEGTIASAGSLALVEVAKWEAGAQT